MDMSIEQQSARTIQRAVRKYFNRIKKNKTTTSGDATRRKPEHSPTIYESVHEGLVAFYHNLSSKKRQQTYLASLLNDIDKSVSLLRNIESLDACQRCDFCEFSEEIRFKAKERHLKTLKMNSDVVFDN